MGIWDTWIESGILKRDRLMQLADILIVCTDRPLGPTKIVSLASLGQNNTKKFVDTIVKVGLLEQIQMSGDKRSRYKYQTTKKGQEFIRTLDTWYGLIGFSREQANPI